MLRTPPTATWLLSLLLLAACAPRADQPAAKKESASTPDATSITSSEPDALEDDAADRPTESANGQTTLAESDRTTANDTAGIPTSPDVAADEPPAAQPELPLERFLLLAPRGPLVIDLALTIDGRPLQQPLGELVDKVLAAADTDGDGQATWQEVLESPDFQRGRYGNLPFESDDQRRQLLRMYDRNNDGLVDRDELPRFVTRNAGGSKSFSLLSSNLYRTSNRSRSPVRLLIDRDLDGAITAGEMAAAPSFLRSRDADDDRMLAPSDFDPQSMQQTGPMLNRSRVADPDTAVLLDADPNWGSVRARLEEAYAFVGENLRSTDWPQAADLFQRLDANGDDTLSQTELQRLGGVPADLVLRVRFNAAADADGAAAPTAPLQVVTMAPALEQIAANVRVRERRLSIELPDLEVEFYLNEDPSLADPRQVVDAQFQVYDVDGNGYLEASELPERVPLLDVDFDDADADSDSKLFPDEFVAALVDRQRASAAQIRARVADQPDALFTALDQDGDGRLTDREIEATPRILQQLDRNGDGQLQSHEIPGSMLVAIVRGDPQRDAQLLAAPPITTPAAQADTPRWFVGMDANGDGEIARREFLGPLAQFDKWDANADGYLERHELDEKTLAATDE